MSEIDIKLSKKALQLLIKHVFIGNWVLNGTETESEEDLDNFLDTILSIGKNYNIMDGIEYHEESGKYLLTPEKEEELLDEIDDFEEDSFWDKLTSKLALRDALEKHSEEELENMEQMKRFEAIVVEEEKYHDEFEKEGISRLRIQK